MSCTQAYISISLVQFTWPLLLVRLHKGWNIEACHCRTKGKHGVEDFANRSCAKKLNWQNEAITQFVELQKKSRRTERVSTNKVSYQTAVC